LYYRPGFYEKIYGICIYDRAPKPYLAGLSEVTTDTTDRY